MALRIRKAQSYELEQAWRSVATCGACVVHQFLLDLFLGRSNMTGIYLHAQSIAYAFLKKKTAASAVWLLKAIATPWYDKYEYCSVDSIVLPSWRTEANTDSPACVRSTATNLQTSAFCYLLLHIYIQHTYISSTQAITERERERETERERGKMPCMHMSDCITSPMICTPRWIGYSPKQFCSR